MSSTRNTYVNTQRLYTDDSPPMGRFVVEEGSPFYEISGYGRMKPFLMTVVSPANHWMYLSSTGGLTCGRQDPDHAIFPYYTDDKIHDSIATTGPFSAIRVLEREGDQLWIPFSDRYGALYNVDRRLLKSSYGEQIIFEERNKSLGLTFRYRWQFSRSYGFLRSAELWNKGDRTVSLEILDGLRNLLPAGVDRSTQERASTLVDAYKLSELSRETGLGLFSMSSIITDRAEPSEALEATTVWHYGLPDPEVLLSEEQVEGFVRRGEPPVSEKTVRGRRGAYFVSAGVELRAGKAHSWKFVVDTASDTASVTNLEDDLRTRGAGELIREVEKEVAEGREELISLVARADGLQSTADVPVSHRHYSNVLFNIMRGGIPAEGYLVNSEDLRLLIRGWNAPLLQSAARFIEELPRELSYQDLLTEAERQGNPDLRRIVQEYLPFSFSRRHGDPSRPWNRFSIELEKRDGERSLSWQGNWRDIFQNWEALALSFPRYLGSMITKFLNATTADGYNPYRISREGIDWETFDPTDPWSNIGYWGDHQIVYLFRLLELYRRYEPGKLKELLERRDYVFADVPYRIRPFEQILENPQETVDYDDQRSREIQGRVERLGADGKLYHRNEEIYRVTLAEKLLVPVLAKLSNLVPDGGIWMNTQRPEWNDANNALAGWGLSMVTLAYLRRFIDFLLELFPEEEEAELDLTAAVAEMCEAMVALLGEYEGRGEFDPEERFRFVKRAGEIGSFYRTQVYQGAFGGKQRSLSVASIRHLLSRAKELLDRSIRNNRRADGLYHSYNILEVQGTGISLGRLSEMLEGQVAVLSSGLLSPGEAGALLGELRGSALYRSDVDSYILYPNREVPSFLEKNTLPDEIRTSDAVIEKEAARRDGRILRRDYRGGIHFNPAFRNARDLEAAIDRVGRHDGERPLSSEERQALLTAYETTFGHRAFTGRSGTFFKYEGLGSVYWHMVSKLAVAAQENYQDAVFCGDHEASEELALRYQEIKEGLGVHRTPKAHGAIPTEAYSHTPSFAGAQQPGMTGQVKEDIITRFGELGVEVSSGRFSFRPRLLRGVEFLDGESILRYLDLSGQWRELELPPGSLGFTVCQVPVVYTLAEGGALRTEYADGRTDTASSRQLSEKDSRAIFDRQGLIARIDVEVTREELR